MNDQTGTQTSQQTEQPTDVANNELGPTEKLRETAPAEAQPSAPGAQNPESKEIKNEQGPNTE
ncbi:MAG TPA: hypothetical protein VIW64_12740 [Pyrinomonadaceae bacterium]